jgi:hypothetical protein
MLVRFKLDFVLDVASDCLPSFDVLDFIEKGTEVIDDKVIAIGPGARVSITRATKRADTFRSTSKPQEPTSE